MMDVLLAALASFGAGLIDSIVGGGGLVLVPALFALHPGVAPATLLGTNKSASVWGTSIAAWQFSRRVQLPWASLLPGCAAALAGALAGAWAVTLVDGSALRRGLPFILLAVLLYTLARKDLGQVHAPRLSAGTQTAVLCAVGAVLGFYDGFFGPGTGSFFIFALVRLMGWDFLHASASAKLLNVATNAAALALFAAKGHVWWHLGLVMAATNIAGALLGARLALKHGSGFVRQVFIVVVTALICKTGYDAFLR